MFKRAHPESLALRTFYRTTHFSTDKCAICLAALQTSRFVVDLPCSHVFHLQCIGQWARIGGNSCPLCRGPFGAKIWGDAGHCLFGIWGVHGY